MCAYFFGGHPTFIPNSGQNKKWFIVLSRFNAILIANKRDA